MQIWHSTNGVCKLILDFQDQINTLVTKVSSCTNLSTSQDNSDQVGSDVVNHRSLWYEDHGNPHVN